METKNTLIVTVSFQGVDDSKRIVFGQEMDKIARKDNDFESRWIMRDQQALDGDIHSLIKYFFIHAGIDSNKGKISIARESLRDVSRIDQLVDAIRKFMKRA